MTDFWNNKSPAPTYQQESYPTPQHLLELDPEALAEFQEDPNVDIFDEEDEDMGSVLQDANLRLEQGRLYQMIMNHDIFGETDADPKAIRNVQREMRKFARDRMETMLGMRQEEPTKQNIISSPFNDMEVTVLKLLASKMSKGATEEQSKPLPVPIAPKKDGISAISGAVRPKAPAPLRKEVKPIQRQPQPQPQPQQHKPAPKPQASALQPNKNPNVDLSKNPDFMNAEELLAYDKLSSELYTTKKHADLPTNMAPMVSGEALNALYSVQAANALRGVTSQLTQGTNLRINRSE